MVTTNSGTVTYIPARPARVEPADLQIQVLTPEITQRMNDEIATGQKPAYVYFAFSDNDYLTMSQWLESLLLYIRQQNAILEYYENISRERNKSLESKN